MNELQLSIAASDRPGFRYVNKFGRNTDIDTAASEDIWDGGGTYSWSASAQSMTLSSDDDGDDGTVMVSQALDANYAMVNDASYTLNGQTGVSVASLLRCSRLIVTGGTVNGNVYLGYGAITDGVPANVVAQINAGNNQTLMAIYTVPAGYTGYMISYYFAVNKQASTAIETTLFVRPVGEVFQVKHVIGGHTQGSTYANHAFGIPYKISEKSDIRLHVGSSSNNADISGGFDMALQFGAK